MCVSWGLSSVSIVVVLNFSFTAEDLFNKCISKNNCGFSKYVLYGEHVSVYLHPQNNMYIFFELNNREKYTILITLLSLNFKIYNLFKIQDFAPVLLKPKTKHNK